MKEFLSFAGKFLTNPVTWCILGAGVSLTLACAVPGCFIPGMAAAAACLFLATRRLTIKRPPGQEWSSMGLW
ncbi:MAG: hypothetical protein JO253_03460 [Alphaproteobacteria bacterium]|nr:hypothetical protein [Alphaproteobacteria bacterium]